MTALLEYLDLENPRENHFYANYALKLLQKSGIILDFFTPSLFLKLFQHNSHIPIGQPLVACPALQAPIQESRGYLMAPKCHSRLIQGLREAATETRLVTLEKGTQWNVIVY